VGYRPVGLSSILLRMQATSAARVVGLVLRLILFVGGGLFLGRAAYGALSTASLLHESIAVDGRIVWVEQMHKARHNGLTYAPVFRFPLENGQPYTVESQVHANPPEFKVGDRVKVYYRRDHPEWAVIKSLGQLWMDDVALAFVGLVFVGLGALLVRGRTAGRQVVVMPPG
jgi:hypothetical protein